MTIGKKCNAESPMPTRKKIDWEKVQAALTTTCPNCGYEIRPAEIVRVS